MGTTCGLDNNDLVCGGVVAGGGDSGYAKTNTKNTPKKHTQIHTYTPTHKHTHNQGEIAGLLKRYAEGWHVPVVVTNQITTAFGV